MSQEVNDINSLQEEIGQKVEEVNLLFLDLSSQCTGYTLIKLNFTHKTANFINSGAIWFDSKWSNQDKYHYIFNAITNYFNIVGQIDYCIAEAYMINPNRGCGCMVGPEIHGCLQTALAEISVKYKTIPVQTWRSQLKIKPDITVNEKGKKEKDYKTPTKIFVESKVQIPQTIESNITKNQRTTPSDLYDSLALAMGFLSKIGITKWNFSRLKIQESIELN